MNKFIEEEEYKKIIEKTVICCVDLVIFNKNRNKILLFKRNNEPQKGIFYTAGGRIIKDESPIDCAIRKGKEELGINIGANKLKSGGYVYEKFNNTYFSNKITSNYVTLCFELLLDEKKSNFNFDDQHGEGKWFDINSNEINQNIVNRIKLFI